MGTGDSDDQVHMDEMPVTESLDAATTARIAAMVTIATRDVMEEFCSIITSAFKQHIQQYASREKQHRNEQDIMHQQIANLADRVEHMEQTTSTKLAGSRISGRVTSFRGQHRNKNTQRKAVVCYNCNRVGHVARRCWGYRPAPSQSPATERKLPPGEPNMACKDVGLGGTTAEQQQQSTNCQGSTPVAEQ